jgi:nucleoside diphosphate kinase
MRASVAGFSGRFEGAGHAVQGKFTSTEARGRGARRHWPKAVLRARRVHHVSPTLALVLEGEGAIKVVRTTMGATNPVEAAPGTVRGDLALAMPDNLVHGSDSPESAEREIGLWFTAAELV